MTDEKGEDIKGGKGVGVCVMHLTFMCHVIWAWVRMSPTQGTTKSSLYEENELPRGICRPFSEIISLFAIH